MKLVDLIAQVESLRTEIAAAETTNQDKLSRVHPDNRCSAQNLIHYVALRQHDLRELQDQLTRVGVSSLGRMEAGVLGHLDLVLSALKSLAGLTPAAHQVQGLTPADGRKILDRNAERLLGPPHPERLTRIMVTMPSEAASDAVLVEDMLNAGMDLVRINCAHDTPEDWAAMVEHVKAAHSATGPAPRISFDLAGPKLRTGPLEPGPQILKTRPRRAKSGEVTAPSYVWLNASPDDQPPPLIEADGVEHIPVRILAANEFTGLCVGDKLSYRDARGSRRSLKVEALTPTAALVSTKKTIYWATDSEVRTADGSPVLQIGGLPALEQALRLTVDDTLVLTPNMAAQPVDATGTQTIGCSIPDVFTQVRAGEHVWFDDGKIGAQIIHQAADEIRLKIVQAGVGGSNLRAEKGINFPDTELRIPALTREDRANLGAVAEHADIINMSFVGSSADVADLLDELSALSAESVAVVLKIETVAAFQALPDLLLEAMRWPDVGVMIARGDLAVEAGFERMAELQEEILWLCEAAHVPVIWATQVLESMAKSGLPSRSEITDAAMAQRAEAVMLNKGPFIRETIGALHDILSRMDGHSSKKRDMLRALRSWKHGDRKPEDG